MDALTVPKLTPAISKTKTVQFEQIDKHFEGTIDVSLDSLDIYPLLHLWDPDYGVNGWGPISICPVSQGSSRYYVLRGTRTISDLRVYNAKKPDGAKPIQTWQARVFNSLVLNEPLLRIWIYGTQERPGRSKHGIGDIMSLMSPHKAQGNTVLRNAILCLPSTTLQQRVIRIFNMPNYEQIHRVFNNSGPFARVAVSDVYYIVQQRTDNYLALTQLLLSDLERQIAQLRPPLPPEGQTQFFARISACSSEKEVYNSISAHAKLFFDKKPDQKAWIQRVLRPEIPYVFGEIVFSSVSFAQRLRRLYRDWVLRAQVLCSFTGVDTLKPMMAASSSPQLDQGPVPWTKILRELMSNSSLIVIVDEDSGSELRPQDWAMPQLKRSVLLTWASARLKKSLSDWHLFFQRCSDLGLPLSADGASVLNDLSSVVEVTVENSRPADVISPHSLEDSQVEDKEGPTSFNRPTISRQIRITFPALNSADKAVVLEDTSTGSRRIIPAKNSDTPSTSEPLHPADEVRSILLATAIPKKLKIRLHRLSCSPSILPYQTVKPALLPSLLLTTWKLGQLVVVGFHYQKMKHPPVETIKVPRFCRPKVPRARRQQLSRMIHPAYRLLRHATISQASGLHLRTMREYGSTGLRGLSNGCGTFIQLLEHSDAISSFTVS
ncbi:SubName: Full=Uncharacterized protein {ECO:0000313/EMBL:CCA74050.1} [Serendipita indica DSM 11827]|nr:SubName: Full=Uncharacterized protein {ECO:0000313/EMBL:CCA74050.1} [Serendipita indica DSM 11827]